MSQVSLKSRSTRAGALLHLAHVTGLQAGTVWESDDFSRLRVLAGLLRSAGRGPRGGRGGQQPSLCGCDPAASDSTDPSLLLMGPPLSPVVYSGPKH